MFSSKLNNNLLKTESYFLNVLKPPEYQATPKSGIENVLERLNNNSLKTQN